MIFCANKSKARWHFYDIGNQDWRQLSASSIFSWGFSLTFYIWSWQDWRWHIPEIPAKVLRHDFPTVESFFVEIILHKKKWLINCSYNPHKNSIKNHFEIISRTLDTFTTKYENILLLGDFNACADDESVKNFCRSYDLHSLVKQSTCYKNPENPSCIDLILTKKAKSFQRTCVIETGLYNFHRMTISVLKMHSRWQTTAKSY